MYLEPTTKSSPASSDSQPEDDNITDIKAELERLSTVAVTMIHAKNFSHPSLLCWADTMRTSHDGIEDSLERHEMHALIEERANQFPGQFSEVTNATAEVDERRGRAKVYLTTLVRGCPGNLTKEGVAMLCWEKRDKNWVCWKHVGLGGVRGYV